MTRPVIAPAAISGKYEVPVVLAALSNEEHGLASLTEGDDRVDETVLPVDPPGPIPLQFSFQGFWSTCSCRWSANGLIDEAVQFLQCVLSVLDPVLVVLPSADGKRSDHSAGTFRVPPSASTSVLISLTDSRRRRALAGLLSRYSVSSMGVVLVLPEAAIPGAIWMGGRPFSLNRLGMETLPVVRR